MQFMGGFLGKIMCKVTSALYTVNFVSGMQFLACISTDRYWAVTKAPSQWEWENHAGSSVSVSGWLPSC